MLRIGKYNDDSNSWGILHNLYHRTLLAGYEYIDVQYNSTDNNSPPTLKQHSAFQIYKTETPTVSTAASGNNCIPAGSTSITNYCGEAVYTPADQVYTWASTVCFSTGSSGTWYMVCSGAEDLTSTSLGRALIWFSTDITPTYTPEYGNAPYSSDGKRVLATFQATSTNGISGLQIYQKPKSEILTGTVSMYAGSTEPYGYFICDGSAKARLTYPALYSILTTTYGSSDSASFNIPDFRGIFPKGAGQTTRAAGVDATGDQYTGTLGTYSQDKYQEHIHETFKSTSYGYNGGTNYDWANESVGTTFKNTSPSIVYTTYGTPRVGNLTEPANLGINFIIKY